MKAQYLTECKKLILKQTYIDCMCLAVSPPSSSDIDECADGFVECDSKSTCVNLPGWYHCECRDGYHDNGLFSANGESCVGELFLFFIKYSKVW